MGSLQVNLLVEIITICKFGISN
eukprot:SAG31_NODE_40191_length_282_cov_1.120219_1_plen_22_part_01